MIKTISTEREREREGEKEKEKCLCTPASSPVMASITQCDGIAMNNAEVLLPQPGVPCMPVYAHTDMKERGQRFL